MSKDFNKASEILNRLFNDITHENFQNATNFLNSWKSIVGEKIGDHSRVIDIDKGSLILEVDHPGWSQQILFQKSSILKQINTKFPQFLVKNIIIRVSSDNLDPYKRIEKIGEGVKRTPIENTEINKEEKITETNEAESEDPLQKALHKLKKSIEKGKPKN